MSFAGRSEPFAHETRQSVRNDPRTTIVLNGTVYRVILHADERLLKVRLDTRDAAKLNAKAGDTVQVGDAPAVAWEVDRAFPTAGGSWVWLAR